MNDAQSLRIAVEGSDSVSALLLAPAASRALCVLAHGAGAGMTHPFMQAVAVELAQRNIATLRYQFPFMEKGSRRPDPPRRAHSAVRAAVAEAARQRPDLPLFAGGKSFGGRMTSQAQAAAALAGVCGLVFVGFPLHPAKRPSQERAAHLDAVAIPMLFLQGTRDALAEWSEIERLCAALGPRATLFPIADADHSFHVPARSGRTDADVRAAMLDRAAAWMLQVVAERSAAEPTPPFP